MMDDNYRYKYRSSYFFVNSAVSLNGKFYFVIVEMPI